MTEAVLAEALAAVRTAYRVVVAYQRRMNEVFHRMHDCLLAEDFEFQWWWPNRYARPMRQNKVQFAPHKWAWDLFPGYCLSAEWQNSTSLPVRKVWMGLETDSAIGPAKERGGQPDPATFAPVDDPSSRTEIWAGLYTADSADVNWDRVWKNELSARWGDARDNELAWEHAGISGTYQCFCVPVERLVSRERVDALLAHRVRDWARASRGDER